MADRLYLSCWLRDYSMLRHFRKLLELFPFSKLAAQALTLRIYAIEYAEPPLIERAFPVGTEIGQILETAAEFTHEDCAVQVDGSWDLWQFDGEWKIEPATVTLACFGPEFDNEIGDHLRIEFGIDALFLPQPDIPGSVRMIQSNVRSLLHLVEDIDRTSI